MTQTTPESPSPADPPAAPPGWYPQGDGTTRWWDGSSWGAVAASPRPVESHSTVRPRSRIRRIAGWAALTALIVVPMAWIAFAAAGGGGESSRNVAGEEDSASQSAPVVERTPEQAYDESMEASGFTVVESGQTYYRGLTEEEAAEASCGSYSCTMVVISSREGCPGGFYVKADILAGESPVGWTNEISAGLRAGESTVVQLKDIQEAGDSYRVSEITCMGH